MSNLIKSFSATKDAGVINIAKGTIMMYVSPTGDYSFPPAGWAWFDPARNINQGNGKVPYTRLRVRGHNDGSNPRESCGLSKACVSLGSKYIKDEIDIHNHEHPDRNKLPSTNGVKRYADNNNLFFTTNLKPTFGTNANNTIGDYASVDAPASTSRTYMEPPTVSLTHIIKL